MRTKIDHHTSCTNGVGVDTYERTHGQEKCCRYAPDRIGEPYALAAVVAAVAAVVAVVAVAASAAAVIPRHAPACILPRATYCRLQETRPHPNNSATRTSYRCGHLPQFRLNVVNNGPRGPTVQLSRLHQVCPQRVSKIQHRWPVPTYNNGKSEYGVYETGIYDRSYAFLEDIYVYVCVGLLLVFIASVYPWIHIK